MENKFTAKTELMDHWLYVSVPIELSSLLKILATNFGFIAITAKVGNSSWPTSLMPMGDGTHFIALPAKVRKKEKLSLGEEVQISFETRERNQ